MGVVDTFWQGIMKENANMVTQSFCFIIFGENFLDSMSIYFMNTLARSFL
jgi:hypothetical protein